MSIWDKLKKKNTDNSIDMTQPKTMAEKIQNTAVEAPIPQNTGGKKSDKNAKNTLIFIGGLFGFLFVAAGLASFMGRNKEVADLEQPAVLQTDIESDGSSGFNLNEDKDAIAEEERKRQEEERLRALAAQQTDATASGVAVANSQPVIVVDNSQQQVSEPQVNPILERRLGGGVLVNEGNLKEPDNETAEVQVAHQGDRGGNTDEKSFNLQGTVFTPRVASQRGDKTLLLTRGTTIPCVLVTKIVTDHAGITKCQATKDVWSANGKTVLIERGSVFMGEQTAAMLQGEARVAVRWTQLETPKGVLVQIDSPSVGKLGASGNAAWVNHHFWKRFGGSVMISLIGDLSAGLGKRLSKRQADVTFEQSNENAKSMAEEALRNSINIPPTGTINQGALLNIMVARDVDFKGVYERVDVSDYLLY